ncbi:hypothetical protein FB451DRAFT_1243773 [Mycena latifolia]|nr:hypothetical protein FB451DRAFT_1243773 [Mycena latifolia]
MPRPSTVILSTIPIAAAGILYYHHRRLLAAFPTLRVPPSMEISARADSPAFGMSGTGKEAWMRTHAGDMWTATIPRRLLQVSAKSSAEVEDEVFVFARAFWGSWPLQLERRIVHTLARMGVIFQMRGGEVGREAEHRFVNTARILGGLFVVEAQSPPALVTTWWLKPPTAETHKVGVLGGYHSFAVEDDGSSSGEGEPTVRLCFVSHLILSAPAPPADALSLPSNELTGFSLRQRLIMHFHALYSRILMDLAVKALERGAV